MDTKSLYDAGIDARIDFTDRDAGKDCVDIWIRACLDNTEWLDDYLGDILTELTTPENMENLSFYVCKALDRQGYLEGRCPSPELIHMLSHSLMTSCMDIGSLVVRVLEEETRKIVLDHYDIWFIDCMGYHNDMLEGQREDYETRKVLERREDHAGL